MRRIAFTLVELVVAIAIVVFLLAILMASLQSARRRTKAVLCGSNIKQLALGLIAYEAENGIFPYALDSNASEPPPGGWPGDFAYDRIGWWWFNYMAGYVGGDETVHWCTSRRVRDLGLRRNVLWGNYGVNQSICKMSHGRESYTEFIGVPLRSTDISHPGQTLLVFDSGYSMINWWHAADIPPVPLGNSTIEDTAYIPGLWINKKRALWPGQEEDAVNGRHPNKTVNVGFADGHISRTKADRLLVEKTADGYKNLHLLWRPK